VFQLFNFQKKPRKNIFRVLFPKQNPKKFGKCFPNFSKIQFVFTEIMVQGHKWKPRGEKEMWEKKFSFTFCSHVKNNQRHNHAT
jgi:hypothetical protein